jgi:aminoglycoside phosphotransferase (APT) family kinase protein
MGSDASVGPEVAAGGLELNADHITTSTRDPAATAERLERWLVKILEPSARPQITDVASPEGNGMSSETLLFTAVWTIDGAGVEHRLVARIEPPDTAYPVFTTYDLAMQFRVMGLVGEHTSVPVPATAWYEPDPSVLGGPFFVMHRVDGTVPPDVLPYTFGDNWLFDTAAADRAALQRSAVEALAGIHSITPDRYDLDFLRPDATGPTSLHRLVNHWKEYSAWVVKDRPSPLLDQCFSWLEEHVPDDMGGDALSWGDSRIGNMMFDRDRVVAVLDWEMASVAPPEVDLGWMCYLHLFFQDLATDLGVPGLPELFRPADVADAYAEASGYTPDDLTWYLVFAATRHGAIMRRVTERAIFFGEATASDDIDDLIIHRATLRGMMDGSYWERMAR